MEKRFVIYKVSRQVEGDECMVSESEARLCFSAWHKNPDRSVERVKQGKKVSTPYAYFVLRSV